MKYIQKLISWCKDNILLSAALVVMAFIPLYPKLPLLDITQTWVYIRFEDILVAVVYALLGIEIIRTKSWPKSPLVKPIFWYLGIGGISLVWALLFIFPPLAAKVFPHLAILHYLRRWEYMGMFFLGFVAFRRRPVFTPLLVTAAVTFGLVLLYGAGQKFLGFPAFLTMNEEFAKGVPLRLPSTARIPSTFGGHYDLAAYLVFMIPIFGSFLFSLKSWIWKCVFFLLTIGGLIILLFTASRVSFGVYLVAISVMLWWQKKPLLIIPAVVISIIVLNFTSGASERFYKTFRVSDVVVDLSTGKPIGTLEKLEGKQATLEKIEAPDEESLPKGSGFINLPSSQTEGQIVNTPDENIKKVVYYSSQSLKKDTGDLATISGSFLIQKALVYDISITTRFQGQWPKAIEAFKRNIFLGSGYSTLSVAADGDYFRMLGETGLLGTVAFLGIFILGFSYFLRVKDNLPPMSRSLVIGVFSGLVGLLLNAVLIDVFEASKVAYTFWLFFGLAAAAMSLEHPMTIPYLPFLKRIFTHKIAFAFYLIIAVFVLWGSVFSMYFVGDDFTWLRWAAQSNVSDIINYFTKSDGFFFRPIPKLWYFALFSIFWLKPFAYHLGSLVLVSGTVLLVYNILLTEKLPRWVSWLGAFLFAVLSVHHENIFWISGQSSLLASFFLVLSVYLLLRYINAKRTIHDFFWKCGIILSIIFSMLSYDGMSIGPLVLFVLGWYKTRSWKRYVWMLAFIPLYFVVRQLAGAVAPSGDYGYKLSTIVVNSIGNAIGYFGATLFGPKVIEYTDVVRAGLRTYLIPVTVAGVLGIGGLALLAYTNLRQWRLSMTKIWFFISFICLMSYLGLGGMAERYLYPSSLFFILGASTLFWNVWKANPRFWMKGVLVLGISAIVFLNYKEIVRLSSDWVVAGKTVEQSLLMIKRETFPPKDTKTFFFINTPIRYGRAWIFPTGLNDAIWHMYRESPYRVIPMTSVEEAYAYEVKKGDREVFVFDGLELKRAVREEKVIYEEKQ